MQINVVEMSDELDILRIYICGAHSTGKTTLVNDLRPHLGEITVAMEVAREIIREHGWKRDEFMPPEHPDMFFRLNKEILEKQIHLENEFTKTRKDFMCDRAIDPLVYVRLYVGEEAMRELYRLPGITTWLQRMRKSLVLLLSPHVECIHDDHVRMPPKMEELEAFNAAMATELAINEIPFHEITVLDREQRVRSVLHALSNFKRRVHKADDS